MRDKVLRKRSLKLSDHADILPTESADQRADQRTDQKSFDHVHVRC
jgi:hypothetical protein